MSDFTLEPDEREPSRPKRRSPERRVVGGLHSLEDVPRARGKVKDLPLAYAPCPTCGHPVLTGQTRGHTSP